MLTSSPTSNPIMGIKILLTSGLLLLNVASLFADDYYARQSLELGYERFSTSTRPAGTVQNNVNVNYYGSRTVHIGTNQSITTYESAVRTTGISYRPDVHLGFIIPLFSQLFAEVTMGVDLVTGAIIALVIASDHKGSARDIPLGGRSPYDGFFNFATALRLHIGDLALKGIAQFQAGGYDRFSQNASAWLGLGATYRFAL